MTRLSRIVVVASLLFGARPALVPARDFTALPGFPTDTTDVRLAWLDRAFAPLFELSRFQPIETRSRTSDSRVRVSIESSDAHIYFLVVPERDGAFPVDTAGTYILRRRRSDGLADQVKIFLRSHPDFFVRVYPVSGNRSEMDVHLAGVILHRRLPLPFDLRRVIEEPLDWIMTLTAGRVDWSLFYPQTNASGYRTVSDMADRARSLLHTLPDAEDGAMDEQGDLVLIESLRLQDQGAGFNCAGFAKWIVDGLHMGLYGSWLAIEPLKEKHDDLRGHQWSRALESERDPYFGLDWTRNLATALLSASQGGKWVHPESADVRSVPFSEYHEDVGYPVIELSRVLFLLTVREPGNFYLASFNREFGGDSALNQHVHVAVVFPFFDRAGRFSVVVLERNVETSLQSLARRYERDHVHLVRVAASSSYTPPIIRN